MKKLNLGLIGYGNVGSGVVTLLHRHRVYIREKFGVEFVWKTLCDKSFQHKDVRDAGKAVCTDNIEDVVGDPDIDIVIELIGGQHPARDIALKTLNHGKHLVTANKELLAYHGKKLFAEAHARNRHILFESSVMAGVPIIATVTEGIAGNKFTGIYGIINGTCNYILSQMVKHNLTFEQSLAEAQQRGFAESDPTLDINGMDSTHKLAILVSLTMGRFITPKQIHTEGITHIDHTDIEHAESMNLSIKLLAIAKKVKNNIEAHVHPTLISKDHPLASINDVYNGILLHTQPLGDILLSGEGAGQMAAASGVVSDLIKLASLEDNSVAKLYVEHPEIQFRAIDDISTKFYLRLMVTNKPGVLAQIAGVLGQHNISINSVKQKTHHTASSVPIVMLTDFAREQEVRQALEEIHKMPCVKTKPVAIRMENL